MSHGIVKCKKCLTVVSQCPCWGHRQMYWTVCEECKVGNAKPEIQTTKSSKIETFNGYYCDIEMSREVYEWIKELERENSELKDEKAKLQTTQGTFIIELESHLFKIAGLECENAELKAKLERATAALKFYAEGKHITEKDYEVIQVVPGNDEFVDHVVGQVAGKALKEIGGE